MPLNNVRETVAWVRSGNNDGDHDLPESVEMSLDSDSDSSLDQWTTVK